MRKLLVTIICLSLLAIGTTALAQDPNYSETMTWLGSKLKINTGTSKLGLGPDLISEGGYHIWTAYQTKQRTIYINDVPTKVDIPKGTVIIHCIWTSPSSDRRESRQHYSMEFFIQDFAGLTIIEPFSFSPYHFHPMQNNIVITMRSTERNIIMDEERFYLNDDNEMIRARDIQRTSEVDLYLNDMGVAKRIVKALKHLQKLHRAEYQHQTEKEIF